jgi:hypothetical protein
MSPSWCESGILCLDYLINCFEVIWYKAGVDISLRLGFLIWVLWCVIEPIIYLGCFLHK